MRFHSNLATLSNSAILCDLCSLFTDRASLFLPQYEDRLKKEPDRYPTDDVGIPPRNCALWLVDRSDLGDAFSVLITNPQDDERLYLLASVGFCVDDGW